MLLMTVNNFKKVLRRRNSFARYSARHNIHSKCKSASSTGRVVRFPKPKYGRFLDPETSAHGHECCSSCYSCSTSWGSCCYHIFLSLRLCRFSTDRNQNFSHVLMKICCIKLPWGYVYLGSN